MQMICDMLHGIFACKPLSCHNLYPYTPDDRLDARLLLTIASTMHYIFYVMLGGGLFMSG